jgi:serine/threonine protein kinase
VYRIDRDTEATVYAETNGSAAVHKDGINEHIVCYEAAVNFKHESTVDDGMVALIMPLYQISLAAIIEAFSQTQLPELMFLKVAHCVLGAGARFHEIEKGHCDLKPKNIMMTGNTFTVIDLGAVCRYNDEPRESTVGYYLDASIHRLTAIFDLNCAAVTLARCCIVDFEVLKGMTREHLLEIISRKLESASVYSRVLKICLKAADCGEAFTALCNSLVIIFE